MTQLLAVFAAIFIVICVGFGVLWVIFRIWFETIGLSVSFVFLVTVRIAVVSSWYKSMRVGGSLSFRR